MFYCPEVFGVADQKRSLVVYGKKINFANKAASLNIIDLVDP